MKKPAKIPRGWKKLRKGTVIVSTDKCLFGDRHWFETGNPGYKVGAKNTSRMGSPLIYIRKTN